jgi:gliding motility-associated-like protein
MKQLYKVIVFSILFILKVHATESNVVLAPAATISGGTTVCQNASSPQITFTGSGGTAPYTFTYKINNGPDLTVTTTSANTVTVSVPTGTAGTFTYSLVSVQDSSSPVQVSNVTGNTVMIIMPQANADLSSPADFSVFNGFPTYRVCTNQPTQIDFNNASSTIATNVNYTINWGDGSPNFTGTTWTSLSHTYQVGLWTLTYSISAQNGCNITKIYKVFVGNNPAVGLENPGNTDVCITSSLTFPITGIENNPPGTTYIVTFNDNSPPTTFNHPPPSSITHTFLDSSCGTTSVSGPTTYSNSFFANIIAVNPCDQSSAMVVPIRISTAPDADFGLPQQSVCVGSQICITNTSTGGDSASSSGCTLPKLIWSISPATGFSLASGTLGNDFNSTNTNSWVSGSTTICPVFSIAGNYTITLKIGNRCGIDTITKTICVQPQLTPQFALNTTSGCTPLTVTATNNTSLVNQCATPTYQWSVAYSPTNCGTSITPIPNQTTQNASFNFTEPGNYTITLTTTNSCGSTTTSQTVTVKKPPTVSIPPINNFCGTANITPVATVASCAPTGSSLTYTWSFPGGNPATANTLDPGTISYSTAGSYTISLTVTNECGVSNTASQTFSVNEAPVITNTTLSQTICSGSQTTPVILTANPSGTTFSWTAVGTAGVTGFVTSGTSSTIPAQTITTTNTTNGTVTYTITPSFNNCVGTPINYVITVNPAPVITTQPVSSTVCLDGNPTLLSVALSSTSVTPSYQWYANTVNSTVGGTAISGAVNSSYMPPSNTVGVVYYYCVISLASGGCSGLTSSVASVTVNPLPTIVTQPLISQELCVGVSLPTALSVSYIGGAGTATYQWFSNVNNTTTGGTTISGATTASYLPPVYTLAGTYYYYVEISLSGNGCGVATSNIAQVNVFTDPIITNQPLVAQTLCQGATPTVLTVTASGGNGAFLYQWYSNTSNSNTGGILISGATTANYVPPTTTVGTIYYYCTVTQSTPGCSVNSQTAAVIVNTSPSIINQPQSSTVCVGGTPSILSVTPSTGSGSPTFQWYSNTNDDTTTGTLLAGETNATFTPPAINIGSLYYYCLVTFPNITGNCATIATNTALVNVIPSATIDQNPLPQQSICVGATITNPLSVSYIGGTGIPSYQWYSNNTASNLGGTLIPGATLSTFLPPVFNVPGAYYYYVEIAFSGSGCGAVKSDVAEINVIADPIVISQPVNTQSLCQNAIPSLLEVLVSGGIGTLYNYQWYKSTTNSTTTGVLIAGATSNTYLPPSDVAGTFYYYCIVTQPNGVGCSVTSSIAIVVVNLAPIVVVQPQDSTICVGQSAIVLAFTVNNGVGIPTYQWYSNAVNSNSGGTLIAGANGATYNPPTIVAGTTYYYCVINFSAITGSCSIITTDAKAVIVNENPVISNEATTICSTTSFTVTPIATGGNIIPAGTTYIWTTPSITPAGAVTGASAETIPQVQISQTLINTTSSPATVTYTVTPVSGVCMGSSFLVTVTVNPAINPNVVVTNNSCYGVNNASITTNITGGIPFSTGSPYTVNWNSPNGFTSTASSISNIQPGQYSVTINDAGGCPFTDSYTITEPDDIQISLNTENDITCFGSDNGSIDIEISGGTGSYIYSWTSTNGFTSATQDINNLPPGDYTVLVTDANSCGPKTAMFTITQPPILEVTLNNQTNVDCYGASTGAIDVNIIGGTAPYSYTWSNGEVTEDISNIPAGQYEIVVTDSLGCVQNLWITITQSSEIIIDVVTTPIVCYGDNNATLNATISGGVAPYQYQWSHLATSLNLTNLSPGDYVITVTDNVGCQKVVSINIPSPPIFDVAPVVSNISCFGANDGSINLNFVGGIAPINLVWSDGSTAGTTRNNLSPGVYSVVITDSKPCTISRTFTIVEPQQLIVSANLTHPLDCSNASGGAIDLIVSGGTLPFNYVWSNGMNTEDLNNIVAGNYSVAVTDANGCSVNKQFSLNRPQPLEVAVTTQTNFNCTTRLVNQNFVAQASGGVPPYQYQWSSGNVSGINNQIMNSNLNGTIILTVTDSVACTTNYTVNVDNPEIGYASFEPTSIGYTTYGIYSIGDPIQFNSTITGDYESVSWDFGDGTFSTEISPVHTYLIPKDYVVTQTVTYPFGCVYVQKITLVVEKGYLLVVPTAFTPNNDSINDTYRPVTKMLKNVTLDIYDTWGSLIYSETGEVLTGWDGKVRGLNAENGNYYSKVSAKTFYGTIINQNQTFVLIK